MMGSGDGWVEDGTGRKYWGRYGAAGLFLRHVDPDGTSWFLLAQRSERVHRGHGQWAIPGGAIDAHEAPLDAALREFDEEIGHLPGGWSLRGIHVVEPAPGVWSYTTCCLDVTSQPAYSATLSPEHDAADWFTLEAMGGLPLFEPFADALPALTALFDL
jgi:8-oxo-dGTP diphosphatase